VGGAVVAERLPWLHDLYHGRFRFLAQSLSPEPVTTAKDVRHGVSLNVQMGTEARYECHVDSNPIEGLLYVTTHPADAGGDLVISNQGDVRGIQDVDADATRIHPVAGYLVFFDARQYSHYVTRLADPFDIRVVVAMNFYTPSCTEEDRPADLDRHLFGDS
jgi:2OG-Fe(II) oxygenase superfamily